MIEQPTTAREAMATRAAEIEANRELPGRNGVYWRLVGHMDPVTVFRWIAGERLRGTSPDVLAEVMSGVLADLVFAVAQQVQRRHMKPMAQEILRPAAEAVDASIGRLSTVQKQTAIHNAGLRAVPGGKP